MEIINCYVWHEGEGVKEATEIETCILRYLEEKANKADNENLGVEKFPLISYIVI